MKEKILAFQLQMYLVGIAVVLYLTGTLKFLYESPMSSIFDVTFFLAKTVLLFLYLRKQHNRDSAYHAVSVPGWALILVTLLSGIYAGGGGTVLGMICGYGLGISCFLALLMLRLHKNQPALIFAALAALLGAVQLIQSLTFGVSIYTLRPVGSLLYEIVILLTVYAVTTVESESQTTGGSGDTFEDQFLKKL